MDHSAIQLEVLLPNFELLERGKVRDIYAIEDHLLMIATDRISAFDFILGNGIPSKGKVLTQMSLFWFEFAGDIVSNHLVTAKVEEFPSELREYADVLRGRSMLVKKGRPIPVECVVRGYLAGSGWKEYQSSQSVCGFML